MQTRQPLRHKLNPPQLPSGVRRALRAPTRAWSASNAMDSCAARLRPAKGRHKRVTPSSSSMIRKAAGQGDPSPHEPAQKRTCTWAPFPEARPTDPTRAEPAACHRAWDELFTGATEENGTSTRNRGALAVPGTFFCFPVTSKGILLFCPVSLNACARRKTSSTPTPRARNGRTCSESGTARETRPPAPPQPPKDSSLTGKSSVLSER